MIGFILIFTIPVIIVGWAIYIITGWISPDAQRALGNFMHAAIMMYLKVFVVVVAVGIIWFVTYVAMQPSDKQTATARSAITSQH